MADADADETTPGEGDAFLHLYLIDRRGAGPGGCNQYLACARTEAEAIRMCPAGGTPTPHVHVRHLTAVVNDVPPGIVTARYNAG